VGKAAERRKSISRKAIFPTSIGMELRGFRLKSPTMLASGVLGISFDLFPRILQNGCGAIVSKSIGSEPREGYKNPTMTATDSGYLNAIGLANPGVDAFGEELKNHLKDIPLIVSIFSGTPEGFELLAQELDKYQFLGYELNLSCPHVREVGSELGTDPDSAAEIVRVVKRATKKPVFAKMPASIPKVPEWGKRVESAGADAIVAINTIRAMKIDTETMKPILSNKIGGLSGSAIRPVGVRVVYELYESVKIPVIGVGGVTDSESALEYFLAGASAVQIGSSMALDFLGTFADVNAGLAEYLRINGMNEMKELIGAAHR
jgi:dihydroorotate dehydrogenase (NAD+) catalytic subunit